MNDHQIQLATPAVPSTTRLGQGTAVEQSRAIAEVQAAVVMARQFPRDEARAVQKMKESCSQMALAERAFFRFPRGGSQVSGETINLAKELARCWGNVTYGIVEMRRDDAYGQSEVQAWAWDLESNERVSTTFIVPHARWANGRAQKLSDFRDIYENNANNGARRLREMIFSVLPLWFVEMAKAACEQTLEKGTGDKPLPERIAEAVAAFQSTFNVTEEQIERKLGRPVKKWTPGDLATLQVVFQSLRRGEVTVAEEFPPQRVTNAEVQGQAAPQAPKAAEKPLDEHQLAVAEWREAAHGAGLSQEERDELFYGEHGAPIDEVAPAAIRASAARLRAQRP